MKLLTPDDGDRLCRALEGETRIGLDTEFMRERTYFAQLCLVQVATPDIVYCVDPLAGGDLDGVWDTLMARDWVLHAGRQDIEVIYQTTGRMPASVFDTQIAAALTGFAPQIGYATLVRELFGRELPKSHTRADWSRRPMSDAMLRYAAEDVEYLLDAFERLAERLSRLGRTDWAREDSLALLDASLYDIDDATAMEKLKGARKLQGRARHAAAGLVSWREQRARQSDRPRRWILGDATLVDIAQSNPRSERELAAIDGMPAATARRSARDLLRVLRAAEHGADNYLSPRPPTEKQKSLLKKMQKRVADTAHELGIAAEIIAPRKELSAAMLGERRLRVFQGWRRKVIGERLLALLE